MKINLAENMLRFGVKNLNETAISKVKTLAEQAPAPAAAKFTIKLPKFTNQVYQEIKDIFLNGKGYNKPIVITKVGKDGIAVFNEAKALGSTLADSGQGFGVSVYGFAPGATPYGKFPFLYKIGTQTLSSNTGQYITRDDPQPYGPQTGYQFEPINVSEFNQAGDVFNNNTEAVNGVATLIAGAQFQLIVDGLNAYIQKVPTASTGVFNQIEALIKMPGIGNLIGTQLKSKVTQPTAQKAPAPAPAPAPGKK
jgi:hypothetical protein